jgi:hypothetical protein
MASLIAYDRVNRVLYVDDPIGWLVLLAPGGDTNITFDDVHLVVAVPDPGAWSIRAHNDIIAPLEAAGDG